MRYHAANFIATNLLQDIHLKCPKFFYSPNNQVWTLYRLYDWEYYARLRHIKDEEFSTWVSKILKLACLIPPPIHIYGLMNLHPRLMIMRSNVDGFLQDRSYPVLSYQILSGPGLSSPVPSHFNCVALLYPVPPGPCPVYDVLSCHVLPSPASSCLFRSNVTQSKEQRLTHQRSNQCTNNH